MDDRLICAVDCEESSRASVCAGIEMANALGLRLVLLHVCDGDGDEAERKAAAALERTVAGLSVPPDSIRRIESGDVAECIVAAAADEGAELILTGAHPGPPRARALAGDIPSRVIERSPVPVVVVPPAACQGGGATGKAREIVVGVDSDAPSRQAVTVAGELAQRARARIVLAHVSPLVSAAAAPPVGMGPPVAAKSAEDPMPLLESVRKLIPEAAETSLASRHGVAGEQLEALALERGADLIVVGSSRPGRFRRLLFGSTASRLMATASRPVMVVPDPATPAGDEAEPDEAVAGAAG